MERVTATASTNPITALSLRQRAELASRLFGISVPFPSRTRGLADVERRDLAVWLIYQPMTSMGVPTFGQVSHIIRIGRQRICQINHRVRQWQDGGHIETLICGHVLTRGIAPFTDREISEFYREIRKSIWPWRRGRKACGS